MCIIVFNLVQQCLQSCFQRAYSGSLPYDFKVTTQKYSLFKGLLGNHYCSPWKNPNIAILRHKRLFGRCFYPFKKKKKLVFCRKISPLEGNPHIGLFLLMKVLPQCHWGHSESQNNQILPFTFNVQASNYYKEANKCSTNITSELTAGHIIMICIMTSYHQQCYQQPWAVLEQLLTRHLKAFSRQLQSQLQVTTA